jgi:hypothetical protein
MPDWTYQTVFRPVLLRLGPDTGRSVAFRFMGLLSRLPLGRHVIQFMGHMRPDARAGCERAHLKFPSRVGLGCALDPHLLATPAFAEFGLGFLEIGPIRVDPEANRGSISVDVANESLKCAAPQAALTPIAAAERLKHDGPFPIPLLARIAPSSSDEVQQMFDLLDDLVQGYILPVEHLGLMSDAEKSSSGDVDLTLILAAVDQKTWRDSAHREKVSRLVEEGRLHGAVVVPITDDGAQTFGKPGFVGALETVRSLRSQLGPGPIVIGSVGVHSPADALDFLEAGADLVQVDSGFVFTGPGLPKRINEAVLYRGLASEPVPETKPPRAGSESWFWAMLMGLAMTIGGILAMLIACTRVVLPYDEAMAGLSREQLAELNEHLLPFMTHDRVKLSGTMLAVGIIYVILAWRGIRRGVHWAYLAVAASAFTTWSPAQRPLRPEADRRCR